MIKVLEHFWIRCDIHLIFRFNIWINKYLDLIFELFKAFSVLISLWYFWLIVCVVIQHSSMERSDRALRKRIANFPSTWSATTDVNKSYQNCHFSVLITGNIGLIFSIEILDRKASTVRISDMMIIWYENLHRRDTLE